MAAIRKGKGVVQKLLRATLVQSPILATLLGVGGGGGGSGSAVNLAGPTISGTRGGTLTATPGTWSGATAVSGQWYADGVATGDTDTSFTDTDPMQTLEYRETALPGSVVASAFDGTAATAPDYFEDFNSYADGTRLAERYNTSTPTTYVATATPHVAGWDFQGYQETGDTDVTGTVQNLRIYGGKLKQKYRVNQGGSQGIVRSFPAAGGIFDFQLCFSGTGIERRNFMFSVTWPNVFVAPDGVIVQAQLNGGAGQLSIQKPDTTTIATIAVPAGFATGSSHDTLRVKLDDAGERIWLFINGAAIGNTAGYDLAAVVTTWTNRHGFAGANDGTDVEPDLVDAISYQSLTANVVTASIAAQPSGSPGKKQIGITATIGAVGATGAEYKIETEAGEFVQGWTAMSFASGEATATYLIPDFAYEGQKLRVLVRNIGGTVKVAAGLTPTNGYALQQQMRIALNDSDWSYWDGEVAGRDIFTGTSMFVEPVTGGSYHDSGILPNGLTFASYGAWGDPYNASQLYPAVTGTDDHALCSLNGVQWARTDTTARSGVAPDPADPNGTVSGWRRAGYAHGSVVGMSSNDWPTKLPDDTNLTISFSVPNLFKGTRYPFTAHCKTEPGVNFVFQESLGGCSMTPVQPDGTFDLNFTGPTNASLKIDRTTPISSAFFLSGVPAYETGAPALDIGAPYSSLDTIADFTPFYSMRSVKSSPIERSATSPTGVMTAANLVPASGRRLWQVQVDRANRAGHSFIHVNIPDIADDSYIDAKAAFYRDNLNPGIEIGLERSNEQWAFQYQNAQDLLTRANALGLTTFQLHARESAAMVQRWKSVFGAQADRVSGILAWQTATATSAWQSALDFENAYQSIRYLATAPYFEGGIGGFAVGDYANAPADLRAAVAANDQAAFNAALDARLTISIDNSVATTRALYDWIPTYSVSKGLDKNAIGYLSYEGGQHIVTVKSSWDAGLGAGMGDRADAMFAVYKRSALMGAKAQEYLDKMAAQCPHILHYFTYVSPNAKWGGSGWGAMDVMGQPTDEPYASIKARALIYNV